MTVREFIDAFNRCTSHGWLTCEEALLLVATAEETRGPMVEIGCYQGRSAMLLAQLQQTNYVPIPGGQRVSSGPRMLVCIDPWDDSFSDDLSGYEIYKKFLNNIELIRGIVVPIRSRVEDVEPTGAEFVYCDGDHTYQGTVAQLAFARKCGAKVVAVHDYNESGGGAEVKRACDEFFKRPPSERAGKLAVWR